MAEMKRYRVKQPAYWNGKLILPDDPNTPEADKIIEWDGKPGMWMELIEEPKKKGKAAEPDPLDA